MITCFLPDWDLKGIYLGLIQFMRVQLIGPILIFNFPQIGWARPASIYLE
jgi:hypothetical protein